MYDDLNVPVQFKGTKCILSSCMPTRAELNMCQHFDMTSHNEWNPDSVNIRDLRKYLNYLKMTGGTSNKTKRDTVYTYPIPTSKHVHDMNSYHDLSSDKAILSEISSSFIHLKELCVAQINDTMTTTTKIWNAIRNHDPHPPLSF